MAQQNEPSILLNQSENDLVFTIIGHRRQSKATAVVQMFHAEHNQWKKFKTGVVCFVKDNIKKSYYVRLVDITAKSIVFEQEIYDQFTYKKDRSFFHSFPGDKFTVGLNFASEQEADKFHQAVETKVQEKQEKHQRRMTLKKKREEGQATVIGRPPVSPISDGNDPFNNLQKQGRPKRPKGKKITKSDIGLPSDFRHLSHVGFDPVTGNFDSSNIDPQWRKLLDTVGVTDAQLEDKNTANFIYDFVEKHGGIQEANRQLEAASKKGGPPPPPSRHGPPPPARGGPSVGRRGLPPPPPRDSGHSGSKGNIPAPPPPPPVGVPQPPPPPPLSSSGPPPPPPPSGGPPPPPAKSSSPTSSLPPVSDGRSNLMASIRAGIQLRTVSEGDREPPPSSDPELEGMAGALVRALAARSNAIQQSDESEDEWQDDEDEWED